MYSIARGPQAFLKQCPHAVLSLAVSLLSGQVIQLESQRVIFFAP